jgi:hypothetical protein
MTISIKPTASGSTIEQDGSTILTVDGSGNITPSNSMYPKVPAFRVHLSTDQSISNNTWTKVQFNTENFDINSNFDNSTNYRFTPTVAGYYQVNFRVRFNGTSLSAQLASIYKNGTITSYANTGRFSTSSDIGVNGSDILYMNGTTDYLEVFGFLTASSGNIIQSDSIGGFNTFFSGHLVSV